MYKLYQITHISFYFMTLEASETDLTVDDVPEEKIWDIGNFKDYKVTLINNGGKAKIIDFEEWKKKKRGCKGK